MGEFPKVRTPFNQMLTTENRLSRDAQGFHTLTIDGEEKLYAITAETFGNLDVHSMRKGDQMAWVTTLREVFRLPSKEQITAQESVAKAKEALKAAENTMKVLKESK